MLSGTEIFNFFFVSDHLKWSTFQCCVTGSLHVNSKTVFTCHRHKMFVKDSNVYQVLVCSFGRGFRKHTQSKIVCRINIYVVVKLTNIGLHEQNFNCLSSKQKVMLIKVKW